MISKGSNPKGGGGKFLISIYLGQRNQECDDLNLIYVINDDSRLMMKIKIIKNSR